MKDFVNTRARLFRIDDEREFYAWVIPGPDAYLVMQCDLADELSIGQHFNVVLCSNKASTQFRTVFDGIVAGALYFTLPNLIRMDPPVEQARRRAGLAKARLKFDGMETEAEIIDLAPKGLGLMTAESFENGQEIALEITSPFGDISVKGSVVYCRFDNETQQFRTGANFINLARIDEARWSKLLTA
jgi:hypothetical protein